VNFDAFDSLVRQSDYKKKEGVRLLRACSLATFTRAGKARGKSAVFVGSPSAGSVAAAGVSRRAQCLPFDRLHPRFFGACTRPLIARSSAACVAFSSRGIGPRSKCDVLGSVSFFRVAEWRNIRRRFRWRRSSERPKQFIVGREKLVHRLPPSTAESEEK
jgi:hypothetical protein